MNPQRPNTRQAFSLIELLIVIAIIGLLASIVLTAYASVRRRANHINVTATVKSMRTALMLYYEDYKTWPASPDGTMVIDNRNDATWNQFYNKLQPYMSGRTVNIPYTVTGGPNPSLTSGYMYLKGTESSPVTTPMYNSVTGAYLGCITIYEGYYLDAIIGTGQSPFTVNDGGLDPDGIDIVDGHYTINPGIPVGSCPSAGLHY